jgi:hypothetical protein
MVVAVGAKDGHDDLDPVVVVESLGMVVGTWLQGT